jgi:adenylate kinase
VPDLNLVLLGPPGAGKGTQAKPLAAHRGLAYISSGDLLRGAAAAGSAAGRAAKRYMDNGELVPDALVFALLEEAMPPDGFLLDGFPRTTAQAEVLDCRLERLGQPQPHAVLIDVLEDVLVDRLGGRRICTRHGHEYHVVQRPPRHAGTCDVDGSPLIRRSDDEPATIRRRLAVYHEQTAPLASFYDERGRLARVDGGGDPSAIADRLASAIAATAPVTRGAARRRAAGSAPARG